MDYETEKKISGLMERYGASRDEVITICVAEWWRRTVEKDAIMNQVPEKFEEGGNRDGSDHQGPARETDTLSGVGGKCVSPDGLCEEYLSATEASA